MMAAGKASEPEIFPRADSTVWCCGENSMVDAPEDAIMVQPLKGAADAIQVSYFLVSGFQLRLTAWVCNTGPEVQA